MGLPRTKAPSNIAESQATAPPEAVGPSVVPQDFAGPYMPVYGYPPPVMATAPPASPFEQMGYYGAAPVPVPAPLEQPPADAALTEQVGNPDDDNAVERFKGPLSAKRSCTDILCLIPFFIVLIGFIVVTLAGFFVGNPYILFMGHNSDNQMCGVGLNSKNKFVFAFDPITCIANEQSQYLTSGCQSSKSICVEKCPKLKNATDPWNWPSSETRLTGDIFKDELNGLCLPGTNMSLTVKKNVEAGNCPPYVFQSKDFYFRCEPSFLTEETNGSVYELSKSFQDAKGQNLSSRTEAALRNIQGAHNSLPFVADIVEDLSKTWPHILVFTAFTMVASFIWIILMRFFGPCVIWFTTLVLVIGSMCATTFTWVVYDALNRGLEYALGIVPTKDLAVMPKDLWLTIAILASLITLIILILFCALFNRIRLAAAVVTESSRAIAGSMAALIWPIFPFCLQLVVHGLFIVGMIYFLTATSTTSTSALDFNTLWNNVTNMWPVLLCLLFAWFWISNFILALNYVTLAGSFSSWYWNSGTENSETLQLLAAFVRAVRYHIGTMAFGALIIAIVQTIRAILQFFERQFKKMNNPIGVLLLKCLGCCLWCVEKVLKFITKNAYIMVAIEGRHFCASARKAFKLIVANIARILVLDTLSTVLIGISVFIIVGGIGTLALFIFYPSLVGWTTLPPDVVPNVELIASLLAALCFFSVYKMAIDTIFLNLVYDLKKNDGTPEKPYRAKKSLLSVVGKKNKKDKKAED